MELAFVAPEESGWRGPGAPRREVPEHIVKMLEFARSTGKVGVLDVRGDSEADVATAITALRAGARHMKHKISIQRDKTAGAVRFRIGEAHKR